MSSGDGKEVSSLENEGKTEINALKANLESTEDLPLKPVADASGDHIPPSNTIATASDEAPDSITKILPEDTDELPNNCTDINKDNSEKEIVKDNVNQNNFEDKLSLDTKDTTETPAADLNIGPSAEEEAEPTKPTYLECVSSLNSDDVDSNQDEELVLKWDDDDEEEGDMLLKDEEINKDTEKDAITPNITENENRIIDTDETGNKVDDSLKDEEIIKGTEKDVTAPNITENENRTVDSDKTKNDVDESLKEDKINKYTEKDVIIPNTTENENRTIDTDEMGNEVESSLKDEENNINTRKAAVTPNITENENRTIDTDETGNEVDGSLKDGEINKDTEKDAITPNITENLNRAVDTEKTGNDAQSIIEVKSTEDDFLDDDQEDLLSEIDAQIAELGASISKAENEEFVNIEKSNVSKIPIKSNDIHPPQSIEPIASTSEQVIEIDMIEKTTKEITKSDQISKIKLVPISKLSKKEEIIPTNKKNDKSLKDNPDNKQTELETEDCVSEDGISISQNSTDLVINLDNLEQNKNNTLVTSSKMEADTNEIVSSVTEENTIKNSQKETVIEIDLSVDNNLQDVPKDIDIKANSTRIDIQDVEMDTSNNDDSFAHDSSTSIEEIAHGVNKPNVMLEIPTQELIDLDESEFLLPDKEMSIDDPEIINNTVDLSDNNVEKETVKVEQADSKATDVICPPSNHLESNLNDKQVSVDESVPRNENSDKSPTQDIKESNQTERENSHTKDDIVTDIVAVSSLVEDQIKSTDSVPLGDIVCDTETSPKPSAIQEDNNVAIPTIVLNMDATMQDEVSLPEVSTTTESKMTDEDPKPEESLPIASPKDISAENANECVDVQPSTSQMEQSGLDPSDDAAEVTDSLGLLAESSRVRDEDDGDADGDDQDISDHDDDDDDFDPDDESSNQQTAEHSEEDSAQQSETDLPKTQPGFDTEIADSDLSKAQPGFDTEIADSDLSKAQPGFDTEIADAATDADEAFDLLKDIGKDIVEAEGETEGIDKEMSEIAEKEGDGKELELEISDIVSEDVKETDGDIDIEDDIVCEEVEIPSDNLEVEENEPDVDLAALKDTVEDTTTEESVSKEVPIKVHTETKVREIIDSQAKTDDITKSPSKKKLEIAKPKHVVNIVDLESSSEDEGVAKPASPRDPGELTSVNISSEIEVMSSGDNTSSIVSKQGETVITVPKVNAHHKITSRLNTSEITIKTASQTEPTLVIPETTMRASKEDAKGTKFGALEVFSLDSDDEETPAPPVEAPPSPLPPPAPSPPSRAHKCVTAVCNAAPTSSHYDARRKRRVMLCDNCLHLHVTRATTLVEGVKSGTPLLSLEEPVTNQDLVEISDSDDDEDADNKHKETIGEETARMLERDLADMINATWEKFKLDVRLKDAQDELTMDLDRLEKESAEVSAMLDSCQVATDKLRGELYSTFAVRRHQLPPFTIYDTPDKYFMCPELQPKPDEQVSNKRRLSSASESEAKKPAIPLGASADDKLDDSLTKQETKPDSQSAVDNSKLDDDKDVSVVTLSAEAAPADLPPCGEPARAPLAPGQTVYAMRSAFGYWIKANILEVTPKNQFCNFTQCRIKYENKTSRNAYKVLPARCLAYSDPPNVRMTIGTRVVALFKDASPDKSNKQSFSSGIVAEVPNPVNKYRYLIFFDDGYAQYVHHKDTRLVCECSALVWEEVHAFSREFVRQYLTSYPERPMVRLHTGQSLKTEWNGKWWLSRVLEVDASLVHVYFEQDKRTEWIYRGSTRLAPLYLELQAAEKHRNRPLPRNRQNRLNMPYVEYTRLDEQESASQAEASIKAQQEEIRRQRAVAKKSTTPTALPPQQQPGNLDAVTSRVVYYTPKNAVRPYKMASHTCGPKCKRTDVLALKDLRTYNPLAKPLLSGWERQIVRFKGHKEVMYRAPCGRRLRNMAELHRYLRTVQSDMGVDLFDFGPNTHCLAEFVLNKCIVGKKDLSHGKENVPVPCVNYYDESLPEFCSYNTERTPTAGVPLNLDPEFLCGCDCTDDCQDKSKCACWQMTLEGARTIGMDDSQVGYVYKRLPDPLPSGIYECNVRCKCKATCLNRVAQHPLQLKLQVFKTLNRGWGIRALNDVPKGCFLCIYAGNLLTDATANLDGLNEGDEYLAELDYIEVVEQMKEGYEDDIPENDKKLDKKESGKDESSSEETESDEEAKNSKSDAEDGDFEPGFIPGFITGFNKRLRKRDKKKQKEKKEDAQTEGREGGEDCITISDDEELREPSRFAAQVGMGGEFISKYRSVRTLFGKDEACYIMDAKVQGNIGRYLNHSCSPNVFVQNVFVDTHDPRFPWVAFFALTHIRAGTELTWNYNYDVGSVPGKALYCYCGAPNCRGRLL